MSAYATQLSELDHHNLLQEALRQRERAKTAERRADALERALRGLVQMIDLATVRFSLDRSDAWAEYHRALTEARAALAKQEPDQPAQDGGRLDPAGAISKSHAAAWPEQMCGALRRGTDQPAQDAGERAVQDGGRGANPENVNDYLDGHDNGLNVGYRQGWNDALEQAAETAKHVGENNPWPHNVGAFRAEDAIRNFQPDQPAQDGGRDDTAPALEFGYTNWRGEQSTRRVWPIHLWYGATEYHPDKQWFLKAFDTDKQAERDFALRDIRNLQSDQPAELIGGEVGREFGADQPASFRDRLANILSDAGADPEGADELLAAIEQAVADESADAGEPFQTRVWPWLIHCFGEQIARDGRERNHRFLEEALELVQSTGCTASEAHQLVDYVFGRPVGEPHQETGGVMVTLAALCLAHGLDMHAAGEDELTRVWSKADKIRAKQAAKPAHGPLPGPSEPADAGEPNIRPRCSHTRLVKDRCPICGPLDDDNRPVTNGDTPAPDAAAIGIRQQISEAQEQVAAWPKWMTKTARVHEPSCCARTREECARLADRRADDLLSLANEAQREGASGTSHDLRQEAGQVRKVAAAIRRTGDTGGGDE
jgi:hypothetical protein